MYAWKLHSCLKMCDITVHWLWERKVEQGWGVRGKMGKYQKQWTPFSNKTYIHTYRATERKQEASGTWTANNFYTVCFKYCGHDLRFRYCLMKRLSEESFSRHRSMKHQYYGTNWWLITVLKQMLVNSRRTLMAF